MRVQSVAFSLTITLFLALAAAGLAFVAGRAAADPEGRYEHGVQEGQRMGRTEARAEFAPRSDAYRAIFDKGRAEGMRVGRREGRRAGAREFETAGRNDVFDRFDGGWTIGSWYMVNIRPGDDGARYAIGARVPVRPGSTYRICRRVQVCRISR